jgi:membrane protein YdbS with pleckstrin-like domain
MASLPPVTVDPQLEAQVFALERPTRQLLTYYTLCCLPLVLLPPLAIVVWLANYFRYQTLRYRFDAEGVSMRWGILFRKEVLLNYGRIQDIHLVSNVVERWLGLARVQVQTASGSSTPEVTIEGLAEFEKIRDYLYLRMRGTRDNPSPAPRPAMIPGHRSDPSLPPPLPTSGSGTAESRELAAVLREVAEELRALRAALPPR